MDETLERKLRHDLKNLVQRQRLILDMLLEKDQEMETVYLIEEMDKTLKESDRTWEKLRSTYL